MLQISNKTKFILLIFLISFSAILFFFNNRAEKIIDSSVTFPRESVQKKQYTAEVLKKMIPAEIDSVFFDYGIKREWIIELTGKPQQKKEKKQQKPVKQKEKTVQSTQPFNENLWFAKTVFIPKDVSIAEIYLDINNFLRTVDFASTSNEDIKTGNLSVGIFNLSDSSRKVLAQINFIYSDGIKRDAAEICIILDNLDKFRAPQLEKMLSSTERFSVIFPDNIDKLDLQNLVLESKRDYLLKAEIGLTDDITAEFRSDMKDKEIRSKVSSLCYEFDKSSGVILVNNKQQFRLETEILYEFSKRQLKAYKDTLFIKFTPGEKDKKKIEELLISMSNRAKAGNRSQIYIVNFNEEDFQNFTAKVREIKKRGFKFFNFSDIIKRRTKMEITAPLTVSENSPPLYGPLPAKKQADAKKEKTKKGNKK